jgi:hypothetical protein
MGLAIACRTLGNLPTPFQASAASARNRFTSRSTKLRTFADAYRPLRCMTWIGSGGGPEDAERQEWVIYDQTGTVANGRKEAVNLFPPFTQATNVCVRILWAIPLYTLSLRLDIEITTVRSRA